MNDEIKYWLDGLDDLSFNKVLDYKQFTIVI